MLRRRGVIDDADHTSKAGVESEDKRRSRPSMVGRCVCVMVVCWMVIICIGASSSKENNLSFLRTSILAKDPFLLSREDTVNVTTDVRGNLGPASVLNQKLPGGNWLEDRWQAASDMHGTAIHGAHWATLSFPQYIVAHKMVLDWETAVSTDYEIQGLDRKDQWISLFDSKSNRYTTEQFGQSPGVKKKMPLHIIHILTIAEKKSERVPVKEIRVWIRTSDHGWGVSLWQIDVYGWIE